MVELNSDAAGGDRTNVRENSVSLVTEEEAEGRVAEFYRTIRAEREGELDEDLGLNKLWLLLGNDPDLLKVVWDHMHHMYHGGEIPFELKSKISLVVASVMECEACKFFHESTLENLGIDESAIEDLKGLEIRETGFSPSEEVVLKFAQKATENPHAITDTDLEALRELGFSEAELLEILDCIAIHVYTAVLQAISGIVYPGMSREEWTTLA
ncbi:carboxymuconolactone decarboxylase family protein [Halalkalicoccus sp. NIPERK01]|uniref:carboxymuconolactone decarboxylase family protein n=1 Tax=Halalkalicoccus sp. NIPERK01 TaxID=3053469 RepID=UPI00256EF868|nr:hypothetical protein [Halalkalicoccus sp. NIPERK01]MDL5363875.1 hypothetical protein [Halalkalicoccus sp. NIPERK01]